MRNVLFLLSLCTISYFTHGQSLTMYPHFGGTYYEYARDTSVFHVSVKQVLQIMHDDPLAREEFRKAKTKNSWASVMGFTGGLMLVFPVATAIAGGEPEWVLAASGAALIIGSIPLTKSSKRQAQNAVNMYNKNHAFRPRATYFLSGLGARVVIRF